MKPMNDIKTQVACVCVCVCVWGGEGVFAVYVCVHMYNMIR